MFASDHVLRSKDIVLQNMPVEAHEETSLLHLKPFEGRIYKLS